MFLTSQLVRILERESGEKVAATDLPIVGGILRKMLRHPLPLPQKLAAFVRAVKLNKEIYDTEGKMMVIWRETVPAIHALHEDARDMLLTEAEREEAAREARGLRRRALADHAKLEEAYHRLASEMRHNTASRFLPHYDFSPIFTTETLDVLTKPEGRA